MATVAVRKMPSLKEWVQKKSLAASEPAGGYSDGTCGIESSALPGMVENCNDTYHPIAKQNNQKYQSGPPKELLLESIAKGSLGKT